jgi:hypothetical protein
MTGASHHEHDGCSHDLLLPIAFAGGGMLEAWIGDGRWFGLMWAFLTFISGVAIGAYFQRKPKKGT